MSARVCAGAVVAGAIYNYSQTHKSPTHCVAVCCAHALGFHMPPLNTFFSTAATHATCAVSASAGTMPSMDSAQRSALRLFLRAVSAHAAHTDSHAHARVNTTQNSKQHVPPLSLYLSWLLIISSPALPTMLSLSTTQFLIFCCPLAQVTFQLPKASTKVATNSFLPIVWSYNNVWARSDAAYSCLALSSCCLSPYFASSSFSLMSAHPLHCISVCSWPIAFRLHLTSFTAGAGLY